MLSLSQVQAFVAVVDEGGFQGAAKRLGLAQPTVSQQLRRLEEALGVALITRSHARSQPTAQGRRLLPHARGLLRAAARAAAAVAPTSLAIGASSNVGTYLLPAQVKRFAEELPSCRIALALAPNPEIAQRLEEGQVDVAVMEWWDDRPGFAAARWRREALAVIVPPGHPWARHKTVPKAALLDTDMIGGEPGTGTGRLLQQVFGDAASRLRVVMSLGSTAAVKEAVKAGLGISLVYAAAVADEVKAGTLHAMRLADAELAKDVFVVLPQDVPATAPAARFAALLAR